MADDDDKSHVLVYSQFLVLRPRFKHWEPRRRFLGQLFYQHGCRCSCAPCIHSHVDWEGRRPPSSGNATRGRGSHVWVSPYSMLMPIVGMQGSQCFNLMARSNLAFLGHLLLLLLISNPPPTPPSLSLSVACHAPGTLLNRCRLPKTKEKLGLPRNFHPVAGGALPS